MASSIRNKSAKIADKGDGATAAPPLLQQAAARLGWGSIVDGLLGGVGGATAVVCASFAIYMSAHPRPAFNGLEHLMIFAQPNYQDPASIAETAPPADRKGIDYIATGTIHAARASAPPPSIDFDVPLVSNYRLHYVRDGEALIVGKDDAVYRVGLGTMVPGVGRVIAIERRGDQWVVVTPRGLIVAR
ncbi:MAG TPA: hypothetical protein VGB93_05960 [Methylovirgula sp.]